MEVNPYSQIYDDARGKEVGKYHASALRKIPFMNNWATRTIEVDILQLQHQFYLHRGGILLKPSK